MLRFAALIVTATLAAGAARAEDKGPFDVLAYHLSLALDRPAKRLSGEETIRLRMGPAGHLAVGLAIGAAKATLVALIFMHLVRSPVRVWLAAGLGLFWLGILVTLTMTDYLARPSATF